MSEPLHDIPPSMGRSGDPCVMTIFGATGDLTKRKLIPALYNLARAKLLSRKFALIGTAFEDFTEESFRQQLAQDIHRYALGEVDDNVWAWLEKRIYYLKGDFRDENFYWRLRDLSYSVGGKNAIDDNYFYYLATTPVFFGGIIRQLGHSGMAKEDSGHWRRIIIEKPFGHDLESARALNSEIKEFLQERQIYRIDHYLGKETVQNIMVLRFANSIFEPIWNRRYIDHVQITAAEEVGVERRGVYYENAGAMRDMVPNHLFQLLSLIAMEPPISFDADAVRDEQTKVLRAVQIPSPEVVLSTTARGQYHEAVVQGATLAGYRSEEKVACDSRTETFVAMKLMIDNWRWSDVPFYVRTGKRMPKRTTQIVIQFRRPPMVLFRNTGLGEQIQHNRLVIHLQPDEGISMEFEAKLPGPLMKLGVVKMDFDYEDYFGASSNTGYERLLHDCMTGDQTLFQRADMVEAGWSLIQPVLDVWKALPPRSFPNYAGGSWGPKEAEELLERDGRRWVNKA
jgi:glucose-6-phosphate 1-dehydrogenase